MNITSNEEKWRERLLAWHASGQSIPVYCKETGIDKTSMYLWRRRLGIGEVGQAQRRRVKPDSPKFVAVNLPPTAPMLAFQFAFDSVRGLRIEFRANVGSA